MADPFVATILASFAIALISFVGRFGLGKSSHQKIGGSYIYLLPISIGAFCAITFLDLIPEAFEETVFAGFIIAIGFFGFFLLSRFLHEYHHHDHDGCEEDGAKSRGPIVLIGNALHIYTDGVVIAGAFSIDIGLGIATTLGIALHEIPRQVAEMYVLINAGYSRSRALLLNFVSSLAVMLGALSGLFFIEYAEGALGIILALAAGNLLYIATSDLLPSIAHSSDVSTRTFWKQFLLVIFGFLIIATLTIFVQE